MLMSEAVHAERNAACFAQALNCSSLDSEYPWLAALSSEVGGLPLTPLSSADSASAGPPSVASSTGSSTSSGEACGRRGRCTRSSTRRVTATAASSSHTPAANLPSSRDYSPLVGVIGACRRGRKQGRRNRTKSERVAEEEQRRSKKNERERERVLNVNEEYRRLQEALGQEVDAKNLKKQGRLQTLTSAITHIQSLMAELQERREDADEAGAATQAELDRAGSQDVLASSIPIPVPARPDCPLPTHPYCPALGGDDNQMDSGLNSIATVSPLICLDCEESLCLDLCEEAALEEGPLPPCPSGPAPGPVPGQPLPCSPLAYLSQPGPAAYCLPDTPPHSITNGPSLSDLAFPQIPSCCLPSHPLPSFSSLTSDMPALPGPAPSPAPLMPAMMAAGCSYSMENFPTGPCVGAPAWPSLAPPHPLCHYPQPSPRPSPPIMLS